jgi:hypothetical protein
VSHTPTHTSTRITDPTAAAHLDPGTWGYVADPRGRTAVSYGPTRTLAPETRVFPEYPRTEGGFQLHRHPDGTYTARYFGAPPTFAALGQLPAHRALLQLQTETIGTLETARLTVTEARRGGDTRQVAARAARLAVSTLRWRTAEALEKLAAGLEILAQKTKPVR